MDKGKNNAAGPYDGILYSREQVLINATTQMNLENQRAVKEAHKRFQYRIPATGNIWIGKGWSRKRSVPGTRDGEG